MLYLTGFISENKTKQNFAAEIGTHLLFCYKVLVSYWRTDNPTSWCIAWLLYARYTMCVPAVPLYEKKSL